MSAPAIVIAGLKKTYRRSAAKAAPKPEPSAGQTAPAGANATIEALADLSLTLEPGRIFGFIGPNGAGKTTAIKILVGLIRATAGRAEIFGRPAGTPEANALLGYVPETPGYYTAMSAEENLRFYADLYGIPHREVGARIGACLDQVGLAAWRTTRLREFSKGMQQRLGIAHALLNRPPLLIMDEPTSGLDPIAQKEIKDIVVGLRDGGTTIFFSSHFLWEVEDLCDEVGIVNRGRLLKRGSVGDFRNLKAPKSVDITFALASLPALPQPVAVRTMPNGLRVASCAPDEVDGVLDTLRAGGAHIRSVIPWLESLEEVFFRLVTQDAPGGAS